MNKDSIAVPIAIVVAALLIAAAIYFGGSNTPAAPTAPIAPGTPGEPVIKQVQEDDHLRGSPTAPIVIVEYSDFDCPYCNQFHQTMNKIMEEYGPSGKVAWVFRHFPIKSLHPNAPKIAEASECVAELGGNASFWKFNDLVFGSKTPQEFTDMTKLSGYASESGVADISAFEKCLSSGKYTNKINASIDEANKAGAKGTPYPIVMTGDQMAPLAGALPYADMKAMLDNLIAQMDGKAPAPQVQ